MLCLRLGKVEVQVTFWFFAVLACFALADGGLLMRYLLVPIAVHELGHLLVMAVCGAQVQAVSLTARGIDIRRGNLRRYGQEIAVSLGGPAANFLLALVLHLTCFHSMRLLFFIACNTAVALFNLMPVGDLDGGQIARVLAARFFSPDTARAVSKLASVAVLAVLFGFGIYLAVSGRGNLSLVVACVFLGGNVLLRD